MSFKIGSLFDGSGGFPLAAYLCGGVPVWASEVEPYPIAVTRSRIPTMKHLGDISKINGAEIEPVDIITFGSPCQDLSVAGKRAGLKHESNGDEETTRSGLFMEAVRIIKEMRIATNGMYPTFALWENVPGAFSSNKGQDFRIVVEELIKVAEPQTPSLPMPEKSGWAYADCVMGDGWSVAWRVFDAQYWGVPQRRRRIHLVADFRGERAAKVLFEREGLRGYFTESGTPWQGTAGTTKDGFRTDDCYAVENHPADSRIKFSDDGMVQTLTSRMGTGGGNVPLVMQPVYCLQGNGIDRADTAGCNGKGWTEDVCYTLNTIDRPAVAYLLNDQGGSSITVESGSHSPTLRAESHGHEPTVCLSFEPGIASRDGGHVYDNIAGTLRAEPGDNRLATCYCTDTAFYTSCEQVSPTLLARMYKDPHLVTVGQNARWIVRRLTPTECARLQGFCDKWGHPTHKDDLTDEEYRFWLEVRNTHATINGKAVKKYTKEQMLKWYNGLHTDSSEYKMWGNGIALSPALYVMQGVNEALRGETNGTKK